MTRLLMALVLAAALVGLLLLLGKHELATPIPFWLLLPGLVAGALTPGSGFVLKEDNPVSPLAGFVFWAVNLTLYGGGFYALLGGFRKNGHAPR